ncbi:hypothetical protein [Epilithonimonas hungarica]|uniref:Uncharacterized protein n=1 Tax=Epilithonimonas hungarica TaxID=454006 RepID=A0A1G7TMY2_9FLAO|nr:hypothetical protein [Epilithonimonas hungarica]SDG36462.1 hypothetical protein SAMN05421825_3164 [Epilithonimonas hungarica]
MKYYLYTFLCLCIFSCQKEKPITNIELLKKYVILPTKPETVQYEVIEKKLREGSQDCSKLISVIGILKFSNKDFKRILEDIQMKKENEYEMNLATDNGLYKNWYPPNVKKLFSEERKKSPKTIIYTGNFFNKENIIGGKTVCFITDNNEIVINVGYCN